MEQAYPGIHAMKHKVALLGVILTFHSIAAPAETQSCTDQDLIDSAVTIIGENTSPLLGQIKILDAPFNVRPNQDFHTGPSLANILADHDSQCTADVVTNHEHMIMYYGWETINGKTYISVKLAPKFFDGDDASPADDPVEPEPAQASSWEDVLPRVKRKCATEWRDDFSMQAFCIDQQRRGWEKVNEGNIPARPPRPSQEPAHDNYTVSPLYSTSAAPIAGAPTPSAPPPPSQGYTDGRNARAEYESWVNGVSEGEYRSGILFWAARRSDKKPPGCRYSSPGFESGCLEAQKRLAPLDARRKGEPDFKLGWNGL
jgi:hypothetical protein